MDIEYKILSAEYAPTIHQLLIDCFPTMDADDQFTVEDIEYLADIFPAGTIVAFAGERIVGLGTGIFIDIDFDKLPPTEDDLIGDGSCTAHKSDGLYYYGTDICVHPDFRGNGIARELYNYRKNLVVAHNKKALVAAGVLPSFEQHKANMDAATYCEKVVAGELFDPTLSIQLRNGFDVRGVLHHFIEYPTADNWCSLIYWPNPEYRPSTNVDKPSSR